ncbi:MAG: metal homeostatis BSD2 family protein [Vulcanisaeta sp.]|jgi:membrane protein DedA with SNARE-associated domain|nr:metal homeostatis BSD2 family protein [Vulcanisaeta sp.]MCG2869429.1 metal homeostatis BSD2 family protein [Vulcanisaeta sp.]MCG2886771.1 metal homeostatis BSD2 family protein [Vulcanisaeta sp.]
MRLYQLGILLIFLAVLIPVIAIVIAMVAGMTTAAYATTPQNVGGAIIIFPIVPIPILITFGKPAITQPIIWLAYAIFLVFLALIIISIVQYYRARREALRRWQEEHR